MTTTTNKEIEALWMSALKENGLTHSQGMDALFVHLDAGALLTQLRSVQDAMRHVEGTFENGLAGFAASIKEGK